MVNVTPTSTQLQTLSDCLHNTSGKQPLHERFRALFTLKAIGGDEVVEIVAKGFADPSALLKHELAYVLGQLRNPLAIPYLEAVLIDSENKQGEMVRHEAAEALGALSSLSSLELLKKYRNDENRAVRETCEIAVDKIEYDHFTEEGKARQADPHFPTMDPAPASVAAESSTESASELRTTLLNKSLPLFVRYRAMFALRNLVAQSAGIKGKESHVREGVQALADGFKDDSALFRHEVAYIFGQLSNPYSVPALLHVMRDQGEDEMVRHEAAEALGGIASEGEELEGDGFFDNEEDKQKGVLGILREWCTLEIAPEVVRESCQVAVDMWEYENSNQFQYADGLTHSGDAAPMETAPVEALVKQRLTGMDRGIDLKSLA